MLLYRLREHMQQAVWQNKQESQTYEKAGAKQVVGGAGMQLAGGPDVAVQAAQAGRCGTW
jgi:hypothetical protein